MFPVITAVSGPFSVLCTSCGGWTVFDISAGGAQRGVRRVAAALCDFLHGAMVLLADCLPGVP